MQKGFKKMAIFMSVMLLVTLIVPHFVFASEAAHQPHWAHETLADWSNKGWLKGDGKGDLRANDAITRSEFVSLINRSFQFTKATEVSFSDLKAGHWAYNEFAKATAAGYMKGYPDNTIKPDAVVTRQEAVVMIVKLLDISEVNATERIFTDEDVFPAWSKAAIRAAAQASILSGYPDGSFKPSRTLTRAEAVVSLDKAINYQQETVFNEAGEYGPEEGTEIIKGNVTVSAAGVTLRNVHITGNLRIAESVGEGDVYFRNITVDGTTTVQGGGENSVYFENAVMVTVIIDKQTGSVRIVANGATVIEQIEVQSSAAVHTDGITGKGISAVNLSKELPEHSKVELVGRFETVNVLAQNIVVAIPKGSIESFHVDKEALNLAVDLSNEAAIVELVLNAAATVTGQGEIKKAKVNAEGVSLEKQPESIEVGADVGKETAVIIGGEEKQVGEAGQPQHDATTPPSSTPSPPSSTPTPPPSEPQDPDDLFNTLNLSSLVLPTSPTDRMLESLWLFFRPDFAPAAVEEVDGDWYAEIEGSKYRLEARDKDQDKALTIKHVELDFIYLVLQVDYPFVNRVTIEVKLVEEATNTAARVLQQTLPQYALIHTSGDMDTTEGLDGRDFTISWYPSGREGVTGYRIHLIPSTMFFDEKQHPPIAILDASARTWTGDENTVDSLGQALQPDTGYFIYLIEMFENTYNTTSTYIFPNSDSKHEPSVPGPGAGIPIAEISLDGISAGGFEATVGDVVYGKSSMDGYVYLLPNYIASIVTMMDLAAEEGEGLKKAVSANQYVALDTASLSPGRYNLYAVSTSHAVSLNTGYNYLLLYAAASEPLQFDNLGKSQPSYDISLSFNKKIENALTDMEALRAAITIIDENDTEIALSADEVVTLDRNQVWITMGQWADRGPFQIRVAANALKDQYGNMNMEVLTGPIEFGPTLTLISDGDQFVIGEEIRLKTNKAAVVFLTLPGVSGPMASFENEVVMLRGKKIETEANVEAVIATEGLQAGQYVIRAWTGDSKSIFLTNP